MRPSPNDEALRARSAAQDRSVVEKRRLRVRILRRTVRALNCALNLLVLIIGAAFLAALLWAQLVHRGTP